MNPDEIRARLDEIAGNLKEIDTEYAGQALPDAKREEFESLVAERAEMERLSAELEARRAVIETAAAQPESREAGFNVSKPRVKGEDIYDLSTVRASVSSPEQAASELRDRAKTAIERSHFPGSHVNQEDAQSNVERLLTMVDNEHGVLARRILETGSPIYTRAFGKAVEGRPLTDSETRALSTTDASGGYAIPFTLDPTVIHTSNYSVNPYRNISRVVQVVTDNWNGVTSAGVTAAYSEEASEVAESSPTFAQPAIHPERASVFIPFSIELGQDWTGLQTELTSMVMEAKDDLEAEKFTTGAGLSSKEPQGVNTGGTVSVNTAATATFAVGDIYKLEQELPARYRPRAQWVAKRNFYNAIRQFDTAGGAQLWTENLQRGLANNVPTPGNLGYNLLGYQANECSAQPYTTSTGGTIAMFGDFSRFVIVDRIGMSVELVPHLFGASRKPTGSRGFYAIWRNSSQVVDPNAFRKLKAL